jgi:hypothetical protein
MSVICMFWDFGRRDRGESRESLDRKGRILDDRSTVSCSVVGRVGLGYKVVYNTYNASLHVEVVTLSASCWFFVFLLF